MKLYIHFNNVTLDLKRTFFSFFEFELTSFVKCFIVNLIKKRKRESVCVCVCVANRCHLSWDGVAWLPCLPECCFMSTSKWWFDLQVWKIMLLSADSISDAVLHLRYNKDKVYIRRYPKLFYRRPTCVILFLSLFSVWTRLYWN